MYEFGVIRFGYNPDINGRDHSDTITNLVSWLTLLVTEFVLQLQEEYRAQQLAWTVAVGYRAWTVAVGDMTL